MTVTLINASRRMKVANLPHDAYCDALGTCTCATVGGRRIAGSLTLPAGAVTPGLDEAVLRVPDVARSIRAGELRVRHEVQAPKPKSRYRKASRRSGRKKAR